MLLLERFRECKEGKLLRKGPCLGIVRELKDRSRMVMCLGRKLGGWRRLFPLQAARPYKNIATCEILKKFSGISASN